jgi:hypothetical protein
MHIYASTTRYDSNSAAMYKCIHIHAIGAYVYIYID